MSLQSKLNKFAVNRANNVIGLVYVGAAILIIIVGLRGLGSVVGELGLIPSFLLDANGKISPDLVLFALLIEFSMLVILSFVTFFTPNENTVKEAPDDSRTTDLQIQVHKSLQMHNELKAGLEDLMKVTETEMKMVEEYLNKFEEMTKRINKMQTISMSAISSMKETVTQQW